ncbi:hypothetical protein [Aestuariivirga litoralis]|uniref:hypothetical protein n=1 Tax=Aestuariivirga litoralis TaxID=2650924 RepID=UPI0018C5A3F9|nr:hypothetical protein [Aestuariivirga litoralis]MBG1231540.1 hypothetical protein [Aestuariivirga litoralis]
MTAIPKHPADDVAAALARINGMLTMISGVYDPQNNTFVTGLGFVHESIQAMEILVTRATDALAAMYQTCDLTVVREIPPKKAPAAKPEAAKPVEAVERPPAPKVMSESARAFQDAARYAAEAKAYVPAQEAAHPSSAFAQDYQPTHPPASLQGPEEAHGEAARASALPPSAHNYKDLAKPESYMNAFGPDQQPARLTERVEKTLAPPAPQPAPVPTMRPIAEHVAAAPVYSEKRAESYEELLRKITMVSAQAHSEGRSASIDGALLPIVETIRQDLAKLRNVA